ncbi:hypothetical protein [uncultured Pontibacter sp.]|uniref:hypothetical protein n=1 Tax=uncultured Pontibacter sp. TaxID=453356 RepID=UPI002612D5CA|nr:hypothetical protein [uncultured Pontibacter sp.]
MVKILIVFVVAIAAMLYFLRPATFSTASEATSESVNRGSLQKMAALPSQISESSGIAVISEKGQYATHNDAGNKPNLYIINSKGKLEQTITLKLPNVDWEDLAKDAEGNIYIADTGNNDNKRKELAIYKVNLSNTGSPEAIRFTYEDQKEFPPSKKERNFDCEAVFWHGGQLYLISKDRGQGATAKVYQLPDKPGTYKAKLLGSHKIKAEITGAAISQDAGTVALISKGKLHIFTAYTSPASFYEGTYKQLVLKDAGQTEAVAFENDKTLVITSEGGNLYRYAL